MKLNRSFVLGMIALLVVAVALQMQVPSRFDWEATWSPSDANPFGCEEFDSVLAASMPKGYSVENITLWQYVQQRRQENLLFIYPSSRFDSAVVHSLVALAKRGHKVLLVNDYSYYLDEDDIDTLGFDVTSSSGFNINELCEELKNKEDVYDTIYWCGKDYPPHRYRVLRQLTGRADLLLNPKAGWDTLAYANEWDEDTTMLRRKPLAVRRKFFKGELIVAVSPLLFTNYGMLEGESQGYLFRLMNTIADRPVVRITNEELSQAEQERQTTPFRALFRSRPLTWALYVSLFVLLLFFIFNARRRQRAIPVVRPPRNHTLEFTCLIGTLFYQRHDRVGLLRRKWDLFAADIRRTAGVDVQSLDDDDTLFSRLSGRTGLAYEVIAKRIKNIRYLVMNDINITDNEMKSAIDDMNEMAEKAK